MAHFGNKCVMNVCAPRIAYVQNAYDIAYSDSVDQDAHALQFSFCTLGRGLTVVGRGW